jgi:anti-sigma factor RsiW
MRCSKADKFLSPYIDGELGMSKKALLETHLAVCDRCAGELERMRRLKDLFNQDLGFSTPPMFCQKVMERISGGHTKGLALFPVFISFAEAVAIVMAITAGIISGGMLINVVTPHHRGAQVVASLSLESFEELPPDSLGRAYLAMTEERQ